MMEDFGKVLSHIFIFFEIHSTNLQLHSSTHCTADLQILKHSFRTGDRTSEYKILFLLDF